MHSFILVVATVLSMLPQLSHAQKSPKFPDGMIEIGSIDSKSLVPAVEKIGQLLAVGETRLMFRINSPGGDIDQGLQFIQLVEQVKKAHIKIQCVVDRMGASMAFAILQSVCDERYMTKRAFLLIHKPIVSDAEGNIDQLAEHLEILKVQTDSYMIMCAGRLKISLNTLLKNTSSKAWTFGWEEALRIGAIDSIVDPMELPPVL